MREQTKSCTKKGSGKEKSGSAIFLKSVSPVKDLHHVGQCAVFAVADDMRAPLLDLGDGIFGRETDLGNGEHWNIVVVVADAVNVLARNAEQLGKLKIMPPFVAPRRVSSSRWSLEKISS